MERYLQRKEAELALMNEGKALAEQCGAYVEKLYTSYSDSINHRWVSIGATDLQTGFMALMRSIAKPTTF